MAENKGQNYLHGAAILAAGVVIMKILGFIYKVPIGNIIGDDGYSMFLATYNVYALFLTLATAGLPIAISRIIAESNARGLEMQSRRIFSVSWWTLLIMGLILSLVLWLFPNWFADDVLHNPPAATSIKVMAPSVLLVFLTSAYRGYCQGYGNMIPTTVSQVLEVLVKVLVGLASAYALVSAGMGKAMGSAGAIFGVTMGSLAALIYIWSYKRRNHKYMPVENPDVPDSHMVIFKRLMRVGMPIAFGSIAMALLNLLDSSLCMGRLQSVAGFSLAEAQVLYGVYGKAQTISNLPAAVITPLTISVVPAIAAAIVKGERDNATRISEDSMRISAALSMPMAVGIAVLSKPIMNVIYAGSNEAGGGLLAILGIASFLICFVLMETAILQASGKELLPVYSIIVGGLVKIVVNWFLVANPKINIYGAPIGTLCSYVVMCVMNFVFMCFVLDKNPRLSRIIVRPLICSALMGASAWAVYGLVSRFIGGDGRMQVLLSMALAIVVAVAVYFVFAIALKTITREDMKLIPGGEKLARLFHMK